MAELMKEEVAKAPSSAEASTPPPVVSKSGWEKHTEAGRLAAQEAGGEDHGNTLASLVFRAQALADELAARPNLGLKEAPRPELARCAELGLLIAPFPAELGGAGLGFARGTQGALLRILAALGGADLALGRLYEGHVNGVLLVLRYGTKAQAQALAEEVREGALSGVWNTGKPELMRVHPDGSHFRLEGEKTFATGAAFVERPIVTADLPGRGWQMTLPHMPSLGASIDRSFWHPLGMESSESYGVDFTGCVVQAEEIIGQPGDFYRDPIFRGGAIRFAAVHAGAVLRLHALFAEWLDGNRRGDDPYQIARLGEVSLHAQEAAMWVERAGRVAETSFNRTEPEHVARMIEFANSMRLAVERLATHTMRLVTAGVGAHGLLQPQRFERLLRDLTMYLRQPAPDQTLAAVGRATLDKLHTRAGGAAWGFWSDDPIVHSLPPGYFQRIYARKGDPWDFETSEYERAKYEATINSLPRARYANALEVGCSIGVLTEQLGSRADCLLSLDVSMRALETARERCAGMDNIRFARMQVPDEMPDGSFDLIVVSEVAYYWRMPDLERAVSALAARQPAGGHLVLVHLTEFVPDYPLRGDAVHEYWLARPEWRGLHHERHERYRLDVLERV